MEDREIRRALERHWAVSDANNFEAEHDIYREDAVLEYAQSAANASAAGATFSRLAPPNRTGNTSRYGG